MYGPLQWGHAGCGVEDSSSRRWPTRLARCFNGATPGGAWTTPAAEDRPRGERDASMGPRRVWRGRRSVAWQQGMANFKLQWGHAGCGVEDGVLEAVGHGRVVASMGPRRVWRGRH